jgi:hypothetical protein
MWRRVPEEGGRGASPASSSRGDSGLGPSQLGDKGRGGKGGRWGASGAVPSDRSIAISPGYLSLGQANAASHSSRFCLPPRQGRQVPGVRGAAAAAVAAAAVAAAVVVVVVVAAVVVAAVEAVGWEGSTDCPHEMHVRVRIDSRTRIKSSGSVAMDKGVKLLVLAIPEIYVPRGACKRCVYRARHAHINKRVRPALFRIPVSFRSSASRARRFYCS